MLSEKMLKALNEQVTKELYSGYFYLQMAAWFDTQGLSGFGAYMKVQAQEETAHGMILYNYVAERGGLVDLGQIDKPDMGYTTALEVFERVLSHEELVTASINSLMALAIEEQDFATKARLDWFVSEQVEEEANASDLVCKLKLVGDSTNTLFMLDKDLGARVFNMPSPLVGA